MTDPLALDKRRDNFLNRQDNSKADLEDGGRFWLTTKAADGRYFRGTYSGANVSNPPTDAELTTILGNPENLPNTYLAVIDDDEAGTTAWAIWVINGQFWYEQLTLAT